MSENCGLFLKRFAEVSRAIHSGKNVQEIVVSILSYSRELLGAGGAAFWLLNDVSQSIDTKEFYGHSYGDVLEMGYSSLSSLFPSASNNSIYVADITLDSRISAHACADGFDCGSLSGVVFDIAHPYRGILAVWFNHENTLYENDHDLLTTFAELATIPLQRSLSYDSTMMENFRQVVEGLTLALEAKDEKTHGHSLQVAKFAMTLATALGLDKGVIDTVYHGGLLHDIGKIGMDDFVLDRLGILKEKEQSIVRKHPVVGAKIISPLTFLKDVVPIVLHHHERFDGSGYPDGLIGNTIPLGARIVTVCDAFETMLAGRKHMRPLYMKDAISNLQQNAGRHFDPEIVVALVRLAGDRPEYFQVDSGSSLQPLKKHDNNTVILPSIFI